jgi:hypothetical protein
MGVGGEALSGIAPRFALEGPETLGFGEMLENF